VTSLLKPGDPFLYMKVGVHANESLKDIIKRKRAEIKQAGVAFWGYGGSSCHPFNAVQPFVKEVTDRGTTVRLLMQEITSHHYAEGEAKEYSADGKTYLPIPKGIKVLGSRYALVLSSLDQIDLEVSLGQTKVGVGRMAGASGSSYIRGHVDKACLVFDPAAEEAGNTIHLGLAGNLAAPFAVVLK
jgi:hypothetical protein